ncbi:MAG TPA: HEAT repeat domain-containing protein [Phycisphaerae bacterium]|nr:HEAT repeat domain-containing protein [Phycisphaerae bacterium]
MTGTNLARAALVTALAIFNSAFAQDSRPDHTGSATTPSVPKRLSALKDAPPEKACAEIERILSDPLGEPDRQACFRALLETLPRADYALSDAVRTLVERLREENPAGQEILTSRYMIALATPTFAAHARENHLLTHLDLAYVVFRDLFCVDPVQIVRHRYVIFPMQGKPNGHTTNTDTLKVMIGGSDWDNADCYEAFFHEVSHPFINLQPGGHHWRCGGFGEGLAEFSQAYVPARLDFLGPPYKGRFESYISIFRNAGQTEYLGTRLPVEESVSYGPSSSFFMELALSTQTKSGVDWSPFQRMFREAAQHPQPRLPSKDWPAQMAADAIKYFDAQKVRPILRKYRFPPEGEIDLVRERVAQGPLKPGDCSKRRAEWQAAGLTVVADWKVLGPIPDPEHRRLALDPLDELNFEKRKACKFGDQTYQWRKDVLIDECGCPHLGDLPGGNESCIFYLYTDLPATVSGPTELSLSSDDDASVWFEGQRVWTFSGERGVNVDFVDSAYIAPKAGGKLLVKVANHVGPAGFHLRYGPAVDYRSIYPAEAAASDPERRAALADFLGSRRVPAELTTPLLLKLLDDKDAAVRRAAAHALPAWRNRPELVQALIARWQHEDDREVKAAIRRSLEELTFQSFDTPDGAASWWARQKDHWTHWYFVECESAYSLGTIVGGFYGNQPKSYGHQTVSRCWGCKTDDFFELPLRADAAGPRTLYLRYSLGRDEPCRLSFRIRRGERVVVEKKNVPVRRTKDWATFRWAKVPLGELVAGWYRVEVRTNGINVDCDVIGWK